MELGNVLIDIRYWMGTLPDCSPEQVNKERNQAADVSSKEALVGLSLYSEFHNVPPFIN